MEILDGGLDLLHGGAEVRSFQTAADRNHLLQVLAQDLILRWQLGHLRQRSQRCGVAGVGVEDRVLD